MPFADANCFAIKHDITDEQALFLSDAVPTGFMGADFCDIVGGDTVAVWGAGGVGLMAARSALLLGAERAIVIDRISEDWLWPATSSGWRRSTTPPWKACTRRSGR